MRKDNFSPDVIVGVCRGGWPLARVLSDLLENSQLANVKVEFYFGVAETKSEPVITQPISTSVKGKKILVVDDVADTGKSIWLVKQHLFEHGAEEVKTATLYYKPWSTTKPDYYAKQTRHWIVFPWEIKETVRNVVEKYKEKGKNLEEAKKKLVGSGLNHKLVEKFISQILGEKENAKKA